MGVLKEAAGAYLGACNFGARLVTQPIERKLGWVEGGMFSYFVTWGIALGIPVAGASLAVHWADDQLARYGIDLIKDAQLATQAVATQTASPSESVQRFADIITQAVTLTPSPPATPVPDGGWSCQTITREVPNAFRAALAAGKPGVLEQPPYLHIDWDGVKHTLQRLPDLVHFGDTICVDP